MTNTKQDSPVTFKTPRPEDGAAVYKLVANCPPLDTNSMYCNLLQCTHFSATSVAAFLSDELVGFISGYIQPDSPNTLFIWQVAVGEAARGQGLASRMLDDILSRSSTKAVTYIETTITPDNQASWAMIESLAKRLNAPLARSVMFDRQQHFADQHATEMLARIGPIPA